MFLHGRHGLRAYKSLCPTLSFHGLRANKSLCPLCPSYRFLHGRHGLRVNKSLCPPLSFRGGHAVAHCKVEVEKARDYLYKLIAELTSNRSMHPLFERIEARPNGKLEPTADEHQRGPTDTPADRRGQSPQGPAEGELEPLLVACCQLLDNSMRPRTSNQELLVVFLPRRH